MDEPIWSLRILLPGNIETMVHGPQSALQPAFDKWQETSYDDNEKLTVVGFCNTADRSTVKTCVKLSEVTAMTLLLEA